MARMVTRQFQRHIVQGTVIDTTTMETESFYTDYISNKYSEKEAKALLSTKLAENQLITYLKKVSSTPVLLGVEEREFIDCAHELDLETRKSTQAVEV